MALPIQAWPIKEGLSLKIKDLLQHSMKEIYLCRYTTFHIEPLIFDHQCIKPTCDKNYNPIRNIGDKSYFEVCILFSLIRLFPSFFLKHPTNLGIGVFAVNTSNKSPMSIFNLCKFSYLKSPYVIKSKKRGGTTPNLGRRGVSGPSKNQIMTQNFKIFF